MGSHYSRHSLWLVTTGLDPVVHSDSSLTNAGGSAAPAQLPHGLPGNDERERTKEIRRRNADRRNEYSAVANGHGRACKRPGAHLSAFHRGSRPKESFIARDSL